MFHVFTLALAMGLFASAMPGPINVEVVRRALSRGPKLGWTFGMGAVTADVLYATAASLGALALLRSLSDTGRAIVWFAGAAVLLLIGIRALRTKVASTPGYNENTQVMESIPVGPAYNTNVPRAYVIGFLLTMTSPTTIFYWIFASIGSARIVSEYMHNPSKLMHNPALLVAMGVGTACTLWVSTACYVAGKWHRRIQPQTYVMVDRIAGVALCLFAIYSFVRALQLSPLLNH